MSAFKIFKIEKFPNFSSGQTLRPLEKAPKPLLIIILAKLGWKGFPLYEKALFAALYYRRTQTRNSSMNSEHVVCSGLKKMHFTPYCLRPSIFFVYRDIWFLILAS